ncbi:hypothetical protein AAZX31_09G211600 [Glycine max]
MISVARLGWGLGLGRTPSPPQPRAPRDHPSYPVSSTSCHHLLLRVALSLVPPPTRRARLTTPTNIVTARTSKHTRFVRMSQEHQIYKQETRTPNINQYHLLYAVTARR